MDTRKVVVILLIIAIVFSVASVYSLSSIDPEECGRVVSQTTNIITGDPNDSVGGVVGFDLVAPPGDI